MGDSAFGRPTVRVVCSADPMKPLPVPGRRSVTRAAFGAIVVAALIPGRMKTYVPVFGVPVLAHELLIVVLVGVLAFFAVIGPRSRCRVGGVLAIVSGLLLYAAVSMTWSAVDGGDVAPMAWTLVAAASSMLFGYVAVRQQGPQLGQFLSRLTWLLGIVAAVYAAESFVGLGLRSAEGGGADEMFGIARVRGPLYGASIGGVVLLPALAWAIQEAVAGRHRRKNALAAGALLVAALGMGSRSALIGLGVLLLLAAISFQSMRQRIAFGFMAVVAGTLAGAFVFLHASTERLATIEDNARALTYQAGANAVAHAAPLEQLFGQGYASYWRWYLVDARDEGSLGHDAFIVRRPGGESLYHPHSTLLLLAVELGVPGVLVAAWLAVAVLRARRRALDQRLPAILYAGIAGSAVTLLTDLLIFKSPMANMVWWTFVFGGLALPMRAPSAPRAPANGA